MAASTAIETTDIECPDSKGIKTPWLPWLPRPLTLILNALIQKGLRLRFKTDLKSSFLILNALIQKGLRLPSLATATFKPDIECPDSKGIKTSGKCYRGGGGF